MRVYSLEEGLRAAEQSLEKDRVRVTHALALRAAQVKHVVHRLLESLEDNALLSVKESLKNLLPPVTGETLIEYALNSHAFFSQNVQHHFLASNPHARELDDALLEMRRIVMQNLSKHAAMKPFQLLTNLQKEQEMQRAIMQTQEECEREIERDKRLAERVEEELQYLSAEKGYDTLRRLEESRNALLHQKKELVGAWMGVWNKIGLVLDELSQKTKTFQKMENAQLRVLQLYLANPSSAREKDGHGAGLLMLLRLSVDSLNEKKFPFSKERKEEMKKMVLEALENPFFSNYFEYVSDLDSVLEQNHQEYVSHPLYARRSKLEWEKQRVQRRVQEKMIELEKIRGEAMIGSKRVHQFFEEADAVCQLRLGFGLVERNEFLI